MTRTLYGPWYPQSALSAGSSRSCCPMRANGQPLHEEGSGQQLRQLALLKLAKRWSAFLGNVVKPGFPSEPVDIFSGESCQIEVQRRHGYVRGCHIVVRS